MTSMLPPEGDNKGASDILPLPEDEEKYGSPGSEKNRQFWTHACSQKKRKEKSQQLALESAEGSMHDADSQAMMNRLSQTNKK